MKIEVTHNNEILDVELTYETYMTNDSIGSYDFSGFTYYDNQPDRLVVDRFEWDKSLYTDEQNKAINQYIYDNFLELEEQAIDKLKDY